MFTLNEPEVVSAKAAKFIDLRTDFAFKKIFGSTSHKKLLIEFLNQLFEGKKKIIDLTYQNTEQLNVRRTFRAGIFDIRCTGINGEEFIIEMQRASQKHFLERMIFYTSLLQSFGKTWTLGL